MQGAYAKMETTKGNIYIKELLVYLYAFVSILIGGLIYILWRAETIRFFGWIDYDWLNNSLQMVRVLGRNMRPYFPDWVIFSLPNGLWSFSYALIISYMWVGKNSKVKYFWLSSIPLLCLGYEVLQLLGVIGGVFCYIDLTFCFFGMLGGFYLSKQYKRRV